MNGRLLETQLKIAIAANEKFLQHVSDRGNSWITCPKEYLYKRLREELQEFIERPSYHEAGDVLNFLAMVLENKT